MLNLPKNATIAQLEKIHEECSCLWIYQPTPEQTQALASLEKEIETRKAQEPKKPETLAAFMSVATISFPSRYGRRVRKTRWSSIVRL